MVTSLLGGELRGGDCVEYFDTPLESSRMMFFDPWYFVAIAPALVLGMWAQWRIRSAYSQGMQVRAPLSGAAAARHVLDSAGLQGVPVEQTPGHMSDHYDPRQRVIRLSPEVYGSSTMTAVGIAAHEAGHAIQHATGYAPLAIRNAAVPLANFGSNISFLLIILGAFFSQMLIWLGIIAFAGIVLFQLINLPVEFNATSRAKQQLVQLGIANQQGMQYVNKVLNAAALTYVAATLQSLLTLLYLIMRFGGSRH
ncbi:MAG: zinc metallopeptidase [Pirellulales bacterium]